MSKTNVFGKRKVNSYMFLLDTSFCALQRAKNEQDNLYNDCLTSMVFSAFSIEAFLNHLGIIKVENWELEQQKLSPKEKLSRLAKLMDFTPDMGKGVFQTFTEIFRFRKNIVHAKTEELDFKPQNIPAGESPSHPVTDWEKLITLKDAERFFAATIEIIEILHSKSGIEGSAFNPTWKASWSIQ